ncbi:MAG: hypothetical protein K0R18_530 [Bacillales bacterium]|jgi:hypothetical protein|nr:hypothetical protein [Bacillales bacterium]
MLLYWEMIDLAIAMFLVGFVVFGIAGSTMIYIMNTTFNVKGR